MYEIKFQHVLIAPLLVAILGCAALRLIPLDRLDIVKDMVDGRLSGSLCWFGIYNPIMKVNGFRPQSIIDAAIMLVACVSYVSAFTLLAAGFMGFRSGHMLFFDGAFINASKYKRNDHRLQGLLVKFLIMSLVCVAWHVIFHGYGYISSNGVYFGTCFAVILSYFSLNFFIYSIFGIFYIHRLINLGAGDVRNK